MKQILCAAGLLVTIILLLSACATATPVADPGISLPLRVGTANAASTLSQEQVRELAWQALDPNTSSHDPANWDVIDLRQVEGREIAKEFEGQPATGCPGPTPLPNAPVDAIESYWLVQFQKRPVSPPTDATPLSVTAPPNVPEPFMYQAFFLIDPGSGQVVARRLICVIY